MVVSGAFTFPPSELPEIVRSQVTIGTHTFIIYGYESSTEDSPYNKCIEAFSINPFHGEVVVFTHGCLVPIYSHPRVKKTIMDEAVKVFIAALHKASLVEKPMKNYIFSYALT
ncbi:hypothetical protein C0995_006138, partial [Termitomyces sp. Mi166